MTSSCSKCRDEVLEKSDWGIIATTQKLQAKAHGIEAGEFSVEKAGVVIR